MAKKRDVPVHGRKSARFHRARKKRYLVVAGGAVTEKQYFKRLASIYDVVIEYQQKNESPEHLADFARKLKEEDERDISTDCYEKIWVVVDVDDFHGHSQAAKICKDNGIELIISNPCFEVWLLDHVSVCPPSFTLTSTVESAAAKAGIVGGNTSMLNSLTANISMPPYAMRSDITQRETDKGAIRLHLITSRNTPLGPICQK